MRDTTNYFKIWFEDKECIIDTMVRNMQSDLNHGYNYFGNSITKQRSAIDKYKKEFDAQMEKFKGMEDTKVNRWCKYDLLKRGVIEL